METSLFDADFFAGNRRRLRELFTGTAPIVITGNGVVQRNGDNNYLFRQDSNLWYLTGIDIADAILVMDKAKEYVILPTISEVDEVFGRPYDHEALIRRSGIKDFVDEKAGWKQLTSRTKKVKHIATLAALPTFVEHYAFYANPARARLIERLKDINPAVDLLDLREHMARMRMVKQPPELRAIQQAVDVTVKTLKKIEKRLPSYKYEYEIEADLTYNFRRHGTQGHGFSPVVAAGKNTCHLHHTSNDAPIGDAHHIYLDVGAEVENYSADITRTYFLKAPSKRERAIVDAVMEVAEYARNCLKPGMTIHQNEKAVEQFMGEKLRELGLIKSITKENVRQYYTHACSHYLGLDTHDAGDYDAPLVPNMVLTVEPGIYIPEENFGVRIEDDVVVTKNGIKVLSRHLPYA